MSEPKPPTQKEREEFFEGGVWVVPGVAPKAGTVLTQERLAANLRSLNAPWKRAESVRPDESEEPTRKADA